MAELSEVDRFADAHNQFLTRGYEARHFLLSGRKEPRTGGVIIACGDRNEIEMLIGSDPFRQNGVAE